MTGSSDGVIGVWSLNSLSKLRGIQPSGHSADASKGINGERAGRMTSETIPEVGQLLGKYETGNRITCLKAFVLAEVNDEENFAPNDGLKTNGRVPITSDGSSDSA